MTNTIDNSSLFISGEFTNKTVTVPADTTLSGGTVLGEIAASGKLAQFKSGNTNGTEIPCYVLIQDVANTTDASADFANICVMQIGLMAENKLIFDGEDDLATIVETVVVPVNGQTPAVTKQLGTVQTLLKNAGILTVKSHDVVE